MVEQNTTTIPTQIFQSWGGGGVGGGGVHDELLCKKMYLIACTSSKESGPSCSKLTMWLVNDSLKFTLSDAQIC